MGAIASCFGGGKGIEINERHCTMVRRLGEGGFSVVDLVQDSNTGIRYALKCITCSEHEEERKALKEAEYYRLFQHRNIIVLVDSAVVPSATRPGARDVLLLFPVFTGGSLFDHVEKLAAHGEHMRMEEVLAIFKGVCQAVLQMHTLRPVAMAHRDIKLGNVLLDEDHNPVLMDFGSMAKAIVEVKTRKEALELQDDAAEHCTLPYRAPELFEVQTASIITDRTDIWSLGCLLFAMIYGVTPFEHAAGATGSVSLAIAQGKIVFPIVPACPPALQELVRAMLTLDPMARPPIQQVVNMLDRVVLS